MAWWAWILLGFVLLLIELSTPGGFYFMFFGLGAGVVGLMKLLGFAGPAWLEWLLFTAVSVVSLALFRGRLLKRFASRGASLPDDVDELVGLTAVAVESIAPGAEGKVQMRGAQWSARNVGSDPLAAGQQCTVQRVQGLLLDVRPAQSAVVA
jgi:hypothetical protein